MTKRREKTRKYLNTYRALCESGASLAGRYRAAVDLSQRMTPDNSGMPPSGSAAKTMETASVEMMDVAEQLKGYPERYRKKLLEIDGFISELTAERPMHGSVLRAVYIDGKRLVDIASQMPLDYDHTRRVHREGLDFAAEKLGYLDGDDE